MTHRLRVTGRAGAGTDHVDLAGAARRRRAGARMAPADLARPIESGGRSG
ncbi:hypothetical protein [Streptomyces sp. KL2]